MSIQILQMTIADYDEVLALWKVSEGIGLSSADSRESIERFLERNPGLSFVAREDGKLVGVVLCGTDGRRGYLYHMAVTRSHRRRGLGRTLFEKCLESLKWQGVKKCHLLVYADNQDAIRFWSQTGWKHRVELIIMSKDI